MYFRDGDGTLISGTVPLTVFSWAGVEEVFLGLYLLVLVVVILASGLIMAYYRHFHPRYAVFFNTKVV